MSQVVKCDQCGKELDPNFGAYWRLWLEGKVSIRAHDFQGNDFCSMKCVGDYGREHVAKLEGQ